MLMRARRGRWEKLFNRFVACAIRRKRIRRSCVSTARFVQDIWLESYDSTIEDTYSKRIEIDVRR